MNLFRLKTIKEIRPTRRISLRREESVSHWWGWGDWNAQYIPLSQIVEKNYLDENGIYSLSLMVRTESLDEFSLLDEVLPAPLANVTLLTTAVSELVCWRTDTTDTPPGRVLYLGTKEAFNAVDPNPSNVI